MVKRGMSLTLSIAVLTIAAVFGIANSAQARQGGCIDYTPGGFRIGICIDDRNTGTNAYPDYWVNNTMPANCRIVLELWDNANHRFPGGEDTTSCSLGRHPFNGSWCNSQWSPYGLGSNVIVHSYVRLFINGRQVNDIFTNSPSITLNYNGKAHC